MKSLRDYINLINEQQLDELFGKKKKAVEPEKKAKIKKQHCRTCSTGYAFDCETGKQVAKFGASGCDDCPTEYKPE